MKLFLDFDGPILDNRRKYYGLYTELLQRVPASFLDINTYWERKRTRTSEADILNESAVEIKYWQDYLDARLSQIEDFHWLVRDEVWPGVKEWLAAAKEHHPIYLVTMRKSRHTLRQQLEYFGIAQYFDEVLSTDDNAGSAQVKIDLLRSVLAPGESGVMVGDTEVDIESAKAMGLVSVAVTCGIRTEALLRRVAPDYLVDRLTSLPLPWNPDALCKETHHESLRVNS
jgi:phosphoglycolate phosphatase-like HAD superfamily hydrolase